MALMKWRERFAVNIKEIDEQHRKWRDMLENILGGLVEYTRVHFATEERLIQQSWYPFFEGHKKIHDDMIGEVELLELRHKSGETSLSIYVMNFLKNWLADHIMGTDKNYGPYLNSKGIV
ncbi:MAG TPA: bacteriohemerythrin [Candidatus Acidoferrales bacterium]|nr:bacteriohemerythrin [Candidatus Acidoferrales bacterium]